MFPGRIKCKGKGYFHHIFQGLTYMLIVMSSSSVVCGVPLETPALNPSSLRTLSASEPQWLAWEL